MKFDVLKEAMYQIEKLGIENGDFVIKHKVSKNDKDYPEVRVIVEIRFNEDLMRKLVPISNNIHHYPAYDGGSVYIQFNTVRGSVGNQDRLDFHLV